MWTLISGIVEERSSVVDDRAEHEESSRQPIVGKEFENLGSAYVGAVGYPATATIDIGRSRPSHRVSALKSKMRLMGDRGAARPVAGESNLEFSKDGR